MTSANKVGEIFTAAGAAFSRLGELTMQLHPIDESSQTSGKWTAAEVEMLRIAVSTFCKDLNRISDIIKSRSATQMKTQLKRKAYDDAGIELPTDEDPTSPKPGSSGKTQKKTDTKGKSPDDVTLSTLNASESEVDVETIGEQASMKKVKLEFDSDLETAGL